MKDNTLYILPVITDIDGSTPQFKEWTEGIEYCERDILLPDGTQLDALTWLNNQNQFDNGAFTKFLLNYYEDNVL